MKDVRWSLLNSGWLKRTRGASLEELLQSKLMAVKQHPSRIHQQVMLFEHKGYIWVVPFVEGEDGIFLKTLFPGRKYTQLYEEGRL